MKIVCGFETSNKALFIQKKISKYFVSIFSATNKKKSNYTAAWNFIRMHL